MPRMNAQRVVSDLRELAARTSTAEGAQRLAWGPVWREAREWFAGKIAEIGLGVDTDSAGTNWVTLPGASPKKGPASVAACSARQPPPAS